MSIGPEAESSDKRWAGRTGAERAADRRTRLLQAGIKLLTTGRAQGVSVRAVHRAAGLSSRYFYESFTGREDLLRAVFDEVLGEITGVVHAAMADANGDFFSQTRASVDGTVRAIDGEVPAAAALIRESLEDATLRQHARTRLPRFVLETGLTSLTDQADHVAELLTEDQLRAAVTAVVGATITMHLERIEGRLAMPRPEYVDHVLRAVTGIVTAYLPMTD